MCEDIVAVNGHRCSIIVQALHEVEACCVECDMPKPTSTSKEVDHDRTSKKNHAIAKLRMQDAVNHTL